MAGKIFSALTLGFFGLLVILSLFTALTSASASLANGAAHAAASTALLASQCLSGFTAVVAFIAGATVGVAGYKFAHKRSRKQILPVDPAQILFHSPEKPTGDHTRLLTRGQNACKELSTRRLSESSDEVEDMLFKNWGW
jgi:hypothetical protein